MCVYTLIPFGQLTRRRVAVGRSVADGYGWALGTNGGYEIENKKIREKTRKKKTLRAEEKMVYNTLMPHTNTYYTPARLGVVCWHWHSGKR